MPPALTISPLVPLVCGSISALACAVAVVFCGVPA